ncbi:phospholipase D family protein [Poseidonocella pacifica]|nr:phospholipase D-like domain-containing protein [Poseidonocella pacifica]
MDDLPDEDTRQDFEVMVTAEQAWPVFEREVLAAREEISCGFRVFDLATPLLSDAAREVGETWFDLLAHVLSRGVRFHLVLSDFDPVMATDLHEATWRTMRQAAALAEVVGPEAARRLRVIPSMHPTRAGALPRLTMMPFALRKMREQLRKIRGIRRRRQAVGLDPDTWPELYSVSHHQKIAVFDRESLYIGGLDLNPRRYDTREHHRPAAETWSDLQILIRGPEAEEAARHLETFLAVIHVEQEAETGVLVRRTLSAPRAMGFWALSPRSVLTEIQDDHLAAFERAQHLIYIETQFLRSSVIAGGLAQAAKDNPDLRLICILPGLPEDVAYDGNDGLDARFGMALQAQAIKRVSEAFEDRAVFASPVQPRFAARESDAVLSGSPMIHVHNKLLITDRDFAMVGSANLNGRSMRWDTETAVRLEDPDRVRRVWEAVCAHWWRGELPADAATPEAAQPWWRDEIIRNGVRRPESRKGFLVPHDPERREDLQQSLPGATEDIV